MPKSGNLLADVPAPRADEHVEILLRSKHARIERIVSHAHVSPPGFWYDQDWAEWVTVLAGAAGLQFEGEAAPRRLGPGDFVLIPPHVRHRVEWTAPDAATVWLAVHVQESD